MNLLISWSCIARSDSPTRELVSFRRSLVVPPSAQARFGLSVFDADNSGINPEHTGPHDTLRRTG